MSKLNPIEKSEYICNRYKEYLHSSFNFGNSNLQKLFEEQLKKEKLFEGPYVDLNLPFMRDSSINQLIDKGIVCKSFAKLGDVHLDRSLYSHQEESIRHICSGRSAVITTGTGSGKTESFLFPILNDLLKDIENGNKDIGIRAIFLYPMNALVNDQIDRVRKILSVYPYITYGFFTGDTKETISQNDRIKLAEENNTVIPENELLSRKEIRENPPHLLFTNYSMLEYLLIRPNDYNIFEPSKLNNWKYVILDEAHSYYGSLGIELSLLMRRLTGLAPKKPRFILTSATLGKQGESEQEIVDFAKNLTSVEFDIDDIIFSKRIHMNSELINYTVSGSDYINLKENLNNIDNIRLIADKYTSVSCNNISEILYNLLVCDRNVYILYQTLKNESKSFFTILSEYNDNIRPNELTALIDLINIAEKDGIGIFDLKYHSFVRPLSGAYISLNEPQQLSLTKTNNIGNFKAFELGNCRYCNSPYIIGKIITNSENGLNYLYQNKEVDIYENYGNNEFVNLDYFLLKNALDEEEYDSKMLEECTVCAKCGCISVTGNLNSQNCECENYYKKTIYRVDQTKSSDGENLSFNNINQCHCCRHKSKSGIIRGLNLGKDEGTALIAQILFEAIDENEAKENNHVKLSLKSRKKSSIIINTKKEKQFLAFSDSRQQASFFASFFDSTHTRMLQKRIIWQIIKEQNYRQLTTDELASYLTDKIKKNRMFPNDLSAHKNAWISLLVDLLKVDGDYDGEGLGLYYFDLDFSDIFNNFTNEDIEEVYGQYNITKSDLETVMQVVFSVFKTTPAVNYIKSTLTPDEKKEFLEYRRFDNFVAFQKPQRSQDKNIRSFLPANGQENMVVRYIKKVFGCNNKDAKGILDVLFNSLAVEISKSDGSEKILIKHSSQEAYQVDSSKYILKNYKSSKYYQCSKCGRLTPYNVHNVCPRDNCNGMLSEVDPDVVLKRNYYRNEYKTKKIEKIVIKEHTAQLDRKKAKQYQNQFKNKEINILSCSTTFEMGIDIGNLETVFMRNVPPTPANYVQRAGRAGRRKDSSAYILTYCGTSSHDYTYFNEPQKMISGVIRPPYFNVQNEKIIVRHLMAICLGFFFRNYPNYSKTIDGLVFEDGVNKFYDYINSHPSDLNEYINKKVLPENIYHKYHNFGWFDKMNGNDYKLQQFVDTIRELSNEYKKAKADAIKNEKGNEIDYYNKLIESLRNENMITSLSRYCVIPKYGFPVDVVDLEIYQNGLLNKNLDLSRDLRIALSEYAPDSEVIADKKKYTSKYISLPKASPLAKHYFSICSNCEKINIFVNSGVNNICKYCGESISQQRSEFFIEPIYGFKTGITKESTRMKPKRSYAGEITYLGGGEKDKYSLNLNGYMSIETSTEDELLIMNRSGFYMCSVCGYSDIASKSNIAPQITKSHKNFKQYDCSCDELERIRLGHKFKTDVARFTIPVLSSSEKYGYQKALSFMYAFLEGISNALDIERTDIDGVLELNLNEQSYDMLIFDNVPGGAGHIKRIVSKEAIVNTLNAALNKVSQKCCDENTSCYNCLRNYYNQSYHDKLKRKYAKDYIIHLLQIEKIEAEFYSIDTNNN